MTCTKSTGSDGVHPEVMRSLGGNSQLLLKDHDDQRGFGRLEEMASLLQKGQGEGWRKAVCSASPQPYQGDGALILETTSRYTREQVDQRNCGNPPLRCSELKQTLLWATCSSQPCQSRRVG